MPGSGEYRWDEITDCDTLAEGRQVLERVWEKDRWGNILESGIRENGTVSRWHAIERPDEGMMDDSA